MLAVPGHALRGVLMGYFIGAAKLSRSEVRAALVSFAGLGVAVLAYGVYESTVFASARQRLIPTTLPVFLLLVWVAIIKRRGSGPRNHPADSRRCPSWSGSSEEGDKVTERAGAHAFVYSVIQLV
ncbi:MAG: PrsW family intramembrane metalloprotease [candidate division WOR-3 bacterium]|nr:MAG: PrsW family intramembrane metalloprotease [candidate division WOR-3 bacterium]